MAGTLRPTPHRLESKDYLLIAVLVCLGLALRLFFISGRGSIIDSDEAIVGLMAKHINEGRPWPIFYYGQPYMGTLESFVAAIFFRLFGQSNVSLKLVPVVFSLFQIALVYLLALRFVTRKGAAIAGLLTALPPAGFLLWSTMARGGFIELVVLGTLSFILAIDILRTETPRSTQFLFLGIILGLGWWTNNQMIFYLVPLALVFLAWFGARFPFKKAISWLLLTATGFFVGSAPFWSFNLLRKPRWQTFELLTRPQNSTGFSDHFSGYFSEALPIIFGARRFWSDVDLFPYATPVAYAVYSIVLLLFLIRAVRSSGDAWTRAANGIVLVFLLTVPLIFSASSFGWLSKAPRYLLPLYSVLFICIAAASDDLWRLGSLPARASAFLLVAVTLFINTASTWIGGLAVPAQPFVAHGDRVAEDQSELYRWLAANRYSHIWTNYWIGYRTAFETNETVTFSRFGDPRTLRIPEYESEISPFDNDEVYVLVQSESRYWRAALARLGYAFRVSKVGEYVVFDEVRPQSEQGAPIALRPDQIRATSRKEWTGRVVDGDSGTRWGSGMPQEPGMGVEVWFDTPTAIAGVELDHGRYVTDVPRHLAVLALLEDGSWCELVDLGGFETSDLLQSSQFETFPRLLRLHFAPRKVRALHFEQRDHGKGPFDWSIAELRVFSPAIEN